MSLQKLENYSNKAVVQEEVLILTELLEDITKNMLAPETFEKIIQLKELSTSENYQGLNDLVTSLSNEEMIYISRYFSILPLLINISEDVDLAYEVATRDEVINHYFDSIQELATEEIRKNPESIVTGRDYFQVINFLERIGDYAKNICEWVVYFETGKIVEL